MFPVMCFLREVAWFLGLLVLSSSKLSQNLQVEVWWPLSLLALGLGALAVACRLVRLWIRSQRAKKVDRILGELYESLWVAWISVIIGDQWVIFGTARIHQQRFMEFSDKLRG